MNPIARERGIEPRARGVFPWILAALLAAFAAPPASAKAQDGFNDAPVSLLTSFDHYWRRYLAAASAGDPEAAKRMLDEIERLRVERNAFHLHDVAMCFVYQGFAHLDSGSYDQAQAAFDVARELSPDLPTARWGLARLAEQDSPVGFLGAILHRIQAQSVALGSELDGPFASWNLVYLLFCTFMLLFFLFAAVMVYRYGVLLYHDLEERLGETLGGKGVLAATVLVLALPIIITAGIGFLAPYWLAVTFGYQSMKEKLVSVLSLLVLLGAAPFADLYTAWARTSANPIYRAALSSVTGTFDLADVAVLRRAVHEQPTDRDLRVLLATQYKNLGDYELAAAEYRSLLDIYPDDLEARVNLGNIYFAQRDWDGALVQYNEVIGRDASMAMAFYNKSLAHAENFNFAEREEARMRAESLDAAAVAAYEKRTGDYRVVYDYRLDDMDILGKFYGLSEGMHPQRVTSFLDFSALRGWGLRFVAAPLLFGGLIVLLELLFRQRKLTRRCLKCGSPFCARCQIGTGRKGLCTQCYHLFFMKDGVSAAARNEKLAQVDRASRSRSLVFRLLSIFAPGAGHISEGMPILGALLLFFWSLGLWVLLVGRTLYPLPDALLGLGTGLPYVLLGMMGLALVLANVVGRPLVRG